jgi:hypothetical protein
MYAALSAKAERWSFTRDILLLYDCASQSSNFNLSPPPTGTFTTLASWLIKSCAIEASGDSVRCW